ncbi:hypothetical protein C8R44DRAFT_876453 [Mycena epipterygia]|nr:hypothetical protein C8R44DRAFT_876453 [Mycena epipterygia]
MTIPVPGVTPIIVAAIPIANNLKADILLKYLIQVFDGLIDHGMKVISYACDGTEIERSVQGLFVKQTSDHHTHIIKDPHGKGPDICIVIAVYRGQSICMIQDSKHALKTFRNNLFSGARLLALGSYTAIYSRIREMALADGSPLFHRDVEKLDRQDDNAATRLFSADTLKYLADHHPEYLGEIVYLFIFGELIDAYQNRSMPHADRVKLVLRARYFLDSWSSFLDISNYNKSLYFLSRECVDIARIIIEGYLSLVYIHRDHLDGIFPLLPWLHSSEACEHVFGESRRIVKDFTMLDFLYMIPKLHVKLRAAVLRAKASDPKARAAGYSHTYFDNTGLDILALSTFPSDDAIEALASEAAEESDSLIALLGLAPSQLHPGAIPTAPVLPSIDSWYYDAAADSNSDSDSDDESISEAQQLQDLIDKAEDDRVPRTRSQAQEILNLTSAALALSADDMIKIQRLAENESEIPATVSFFRILLSFHHDLSDTALPRAASATFCNIVFQPWLREISDGSRVDLIFWDFNSRRRRFCALFLLAPSLCRTMVLDLAVTRPVPATFFWGVICVAPRILAQARHQMPPRPLAMDVDTACSDAVPSSRAVPLVGLTSFILDELAAEEHGYIQATIDSLPGLAISEPSKPLGRGLTTSDVVNFDSLVELRRSHQTIQAARGVRTRVVDRSSEKAKEASLRQQLIRKLHLALKEDQGQATGTGLERAARRREPAPGGRGGAVPSSQLALPAGNSANAALAATVLARKAATKRKDVFTKAGVPNLPDVIGARVSLLRPIRIGDYGLILTARGLMIGHVFGMNAKGGGKYGKHEPVTDSTNISALSKISVQVFENLHGAQFRSIPTTTAVLQTKKFGHIPPINFLCLLSAVPKVSSTGLELAQQDSDRFKSFSRELKKFNEAMVLFRKRGKRKAAAGGDSGDEDEEDLE